MFFGFGKKELPQLTYGKPLDFSADVPIFPPFAMMLTMLTGRLIWKISGKRLPYVPAPLSQLSVRVAVLAMGLAFVKFVVLDQAGGALEAAGSGTLFTPVGGLATDGIYAKTRNPMYAGLVFFALPTLSFVINSAWPVLLSPLTFAYLNYVVIAAEEELLAQAFGAEFDAYCSKVPKWLI